MRTGTTLIEVVVVLAIIAILLGLLVPAVASIRESALFHQSANNLRQIGLATANYSDSHAGHLPRLVSSPVVTVVDGEVKAYVHVSLFVQLLPYIEQQRLYDWFTVPVSVGPVELLQNPVNETVKTYLNPLDPTSQPIDYSVRLAGHPVTSYAYNVQAFRDRPNMNSTFIDGTSNTILFTEHYGWQCGNTQFQYPSLGSLPRSPIPGTALIMPRTSFADPKCGDYYPITRGNPPISEAADGATFQVRPHPRNCDPRVPNASSHRGLQLAMADGSFRVMARSTAPTVFWSAVTPAGGEVIGGDAW